MFPSRFALALLCATAATCAHADPGYYVVTAYDNAGVRSVDLRYWTVANRRKPEQTWPEIGASVGINSRWTTGVLVSWIGASDNATELGSLNWTNDVLLTQGEWPVDVAVHTQWIKEKYEPGAGAFEYGPVLQTDIGRTQVNLNFIFVRPTGLEREEPTELKYQWQLRYRWMRGFHIGLQGFGELGDWNDWDPHARQSHRAGPALFGTVSLSDKQQLKLSAAWLEGRIYRKSGHMLSLRAALEF